MFFIDPMPISSVTVIYIVDSVTVIKLFPLHYGWLPNILVSFLKPNIMTGHSDREL